MRVTRVQIIIAVAAVLVIGAGIFTATLPGTMERRVRELRETGQWAGALQIEDRLVRFFPRSDAARNAVMASESALSLDEPEVVVGGSFLFTRGSADVGNPQEVGQALLEHLLRIAPKQRNELWEANLYERAAALQHSLGRTAEARATMERAVPIFEERARFRDDSARVTLVEWLQSPVDRLEAGTELLAGFRARPADQVSDYELARLLVLVGDAARQLGDYPLARESYQQARAAAERSIQGARGADSSETDHPEIVLEEQPGYARSEFGLAMLDFLETATPETSAYLTGRITHPDGAIEGATIYLTRSTGHSGFSTHMLDTQSITAPTDADGRFSIGPIPPGVYDLAVGLRATQAIALGRTEVPADVTLEPGQTREVQVRFADRISIIEPTGSVGRTAFESFALPVSWSATEGADHYSVELLIMSVNEDGSISGWMGAPALPSVASTATRIEVAGAAVWDHAQWFADQGGLHPVAVLGGFSPKSIVGVRVVAHNAEGTVISDSEGLLTRRDANYPFVRFAEPQNLPDAIRAAVTATLARDYESAIDAWETAATTADQLIDAGRPELALGVHLALGRLYARLTAPLHDTERARHHYTQAYEIAGAASLEIPRGIMAEVRSSGAIAER